MCNPMAHDNTNLEHLEDRRMFDAAAAVTVSLVNNGILMVNGTDQADTITFEQARANRQRVVFPAVVCRHLLLSIGHGLVG